MENLPKLQDLLSDVELKADQNALNVLLNASPSKTWIKEHPLAKGVKYIPIERIEWLMTRIFIRWNVEIKSTQLIANSVVVIIRLWYQDRLSKELLYQDGLGACPLQTDKGAGAIEFNKIKNNAIMLAAPAAESYAFKDAAEKIGKLFGKDLNRKDEIGYLSLQNTILKEEKHKEIFEETN
jgi:hypothetical protein